MTKTDIDFWLYWGFFKAYQLVLDLFHEKKPYFERDGFNVKLDRYKVETDMVPSPQ